MALSRSSGTPKPHSLGLAKVHGKLGGLGVLLGCGNPTQMLNSGVAQQASGVPQGHLGGPGQSVVRREEERQAGWKTLQLRHELRSQNLSLLPVPPGARGLPPPYPNSLSEIMLD